MTILGLGSKPHISRHASLGMVRALREKRSPATTKREAKDNSNLTAEPPTPVPMKQRIIKRNHYEHEVLLLQGGGALGSYHAGVYEGLAEAGIMPTWVVGISIGAVNAAIIAGNPPERRLERLREFWDLVSAYAPLTPPSLFDPLRPFLAHLSVVSVATFGIQGFFVPRHPSPLLAPSASPNALSFYDTSPLKKT